MNEAEAILTSIKRGEPYETPQGKVLQLVKKKYRDLKTQFTQIKLR